jgi:hypothetical protein
VDDERVMQLLLKHSARLAPSGGSLTRK